MSNFADLRKITEKIQSFKNRNFLRLCYFSITSTEYAPLAQIMQIPEHKTKRYTHAGLAWIAYFL